MAVISASPAELALVGVAGNPFSLTLDVSVTDATGNPVPWSQITSPAVYVASGSTEQTALEPTVTSPSSGVLEVSWTAAQTLAMGQYAGPFTPLNANTRLSWALGVDIEGAGPYTLCGGEVSMYPQTTPGTSSSGTASLSVEVAGGTATVSALLGAGGGSGGVSEITDGTNNATGNVEFVGGTGLSAAVTTAGANGVMTIKGTGAIGLNTQTTSAYTVQGTDIGGMVEGNSASAQTFTIPTDSTLGNSFVSGQEIVIMFGQLGAGTVTVAGASGVTINGTSAGTVALGGQYGTAAARRTAADTWQITTSATGVAILDAANTFTGANTIQGSGGLTVTDATYGIQSMMNSTNLAQFRLVQYGGSYPAFQLQFAKNDNKMTIGNAGAGNIGINAGGSIALGLNGGSMSSDTGVLSTHNGPTPNTVTTSLTQLAIGTAWQNTLGYDVAVNVSIVVSAATSATLTAGVGTTATPTQVNLCGAFSTSADVILTYNFVVPAGQYLLIDSSGTITIASTTTWAQSVV